jgi:phosphinothricin acetyltransferase
MITIRPATPSDLPAVTAIYGHHVRHGTGTFETDPPSEADMQQRWQDVQAKGLPWLVLCEADQVMGFAYANWFKPRPAYRYSAEDSIYLHPQAAGRGWGRCLLAELLAQLQRRGVRQVLAVIGDANNHGSVGLHRALGFQHSGVLASAGWKFDQWLDVVLMQKSLGAGSSTPPKDGT